MTPTTEKSKAWFVASRGLSLSEASKYVFGCSETEVHRILREHNYYDIWTEQWVYRNRNKDIVDLVQNSTLSYAKIASKYRISRERVRQIAKKHGVARKQTR